MEKRDRAFVHRISKYANLKNWKDFLNITEIEDEAYGKKGWKVSRFSYGRVEDVRSSIVFRNMRILKIGNWKDFRVVSTGIAQRKKDDSYFEIRES